MSYEINPQIPKTDQASFSAWFADNVEPSLQTDAALRQALAVAWKACAAHADVREAELKKIIDTIRPHYDNATKYRVLLSLFVESGQPGSKLRLETLRDHAQRLLDGVPEP